uniref:Uncharacterized protein n=1 Tax=Arundo donax TaxID=35708 RepID=A0A0A8YLK8_ARUDO
MTSINQYFTGNKSMQFVCV